MYRVGDNNELIITAFGRGKFGQVRIMIYASPLSWAIQLGFLILVCCTLSWAIQLEIAVLVGLVCSISDLIIGPKNRYEVCALHYSHHFFLYTNKQTSWKQLQESYNSYPDRSAVHFQCTKVHTSVHFNDMLLLKRIALHSQVHCTPPWSILRFTCSVLHFIWSILISLRTLHALPVTNGPKSMRQQKDISWATIVLVYKESNTLFHMFGATSEIFSQTYNHGMIFLSISVPIMVPHSGDIIGFLCVTKRS